MNMDTFFDAVNRIPVQAYYAFIAMIGGMARYLNTFKDGKIHFSLAIFLASAFVAGFSGVMFALLGDSLHMPNPLPHIMAGVGGFFGDQAMKFLLEYFTNKRIDEVTRPKE